MLVKICEIDSDNRLAYVSPAQNPQDSPKVYVSWFRNIPPVIGRSYSMTPQISWYNGNKTILVHGYINSSQAMEDRRRYNNL